MPGLRSLSDNVLYDKCFERATAKAYTMPTPEKDFLAIATQLGLTPPPDYDHLEDWGGMTFKNAGHMLDLFGVPYHTGLGTDFDTLKMELGQGHKIIMVVDSAELWGQEGFFAHLFDNSNPNPDHAIMLTGINDDDPGNPMVQILDSGNGTYRSIPWSLFEDAVTDSNNFFLATDLSLDEYAEIHPEVQYRPFPYLESVPEMLFLPPHLGRG